MPEIRTREIVIGKVKHPHYLFIGNAGYPGGWRMGWRGKVDWCQAGEFLYWTALEWHIVRRLELAGLVLARPLPEPPHDAETLIRVTVARRGHKRRPRANEYLPRG